MNGNLRLRVREADQSGLIDPCAGLAFGETEDYIITPKYQLGTDNVTEWIFIKFHNLSLLI
jgi:hypothetical protein